MVLLRASPGISMAGDGRHRVEQHRRAAMAGDEHAPPHLHGHHLDHPTRLE